VQFNSFFLFHIWRFPTQKYGSQAHCLAVEKRCQKCGETFSTRQNKKRHQKNCKIDPLGKFLLSFPSIIQHNSNMSNSSSRVGRRRTAFGDEEQGPGTVRQRVAIVSIRETLVPSNFGCCGKSQNRTSGALGPEQENVLHEDSG